MADYLNYWRRRPSYSASHHMNAVVLAHHWIQGNHLQAIGFTAFAILCVYIYDWWDRSEDS